VEDSFVLAPGDLVIVSTEAAPQRDISGLLSPASN
jgi:hypothetical protein